MGRKQTPESDEARLKKKIAQKLTTHANPEAGSVMRSLRKRLKREQRKRRASALRRRHAGGITPAETAAPAAG
jgi:hypothetical protein